MNHGVFSNMTTEAALPKDAILLLTAFAPFDGAAKNASMIMLEKLKNTGFEGKVAFLGPIPVTFKDAFPAVESVLKTSPHIKGVIALGQAEGRNCISLERVAVNRIEARIPDNAGITPPAGPIDAAAAPELWTTFPWHQAPSSPQWQCSHSAGTYVCNTLMFQLLIWAKDEGKWAGFIHVPLLASQTPKAAGTPQVDDDAAAAALTQIIRFSLDSMTAEGPPTNPEIPPGV